MIRRVGGWLVDSSCGGRGTVDVLVLRRQKRRRLRQRQPLRNARRTTDAFTSARGIWSHALHDRNFNGVDWLAARERHRAGR